MAKHGLGILILLSLLACKKEAPAPLPIANFFVDNSGCTSSCYVKVYDQSYNAQQWEWDFGNGITSQKQHDSVAYHTPGFYNIKLRVWNSDNVEDEIIKQIVVY